MPLIAWWKLDGALADHGPNKLSYTNNGVTFNNAGIIGQCGDFNGSSDYIAINSVTPYLVDTSYSICAWIQSNGGDNEEVVSINNSAGTINRMLWRVDAGNGMLMYINHSAKTVGTVSVSDGDWYHVCYVYDREASEVRQYVNGTNDRTHSSITTAITATDKCTIGAEWDSTVGVGDYFGGFINDVRIYDHGLSLKEIKALAQCKLVHYRFSEDRGNSGLIVTDSSDYGNHADAWTSDMATWGNTSPGQGVGYYTFDSTDMIPLTANFDGRAAADTAWTCAAWVKMSDAGSHQRLVHGLHNGVYLQYDTSDKALIYLDASPAHYCYSTDLSSILYNNVWHQVVFVFDNRVSAIKIYVDAVDKSDTPVGSSNIDTNLTTWEIGDTSQCSIADFRFYNIPLTGTEIAELYQTSAQIDNKGNLWC